VNFIDSAKVAVLCGTNGVFCAGFDLKALSSGALLPIQPVGVGDGPMVCVCVCVCVYVCFAKQTVLLSFILYSLRMHVMSVCVIAL